MVKAAPGNVYFTNAGIAANGTNPDPPPNNELTLDAQENLGMTAFDLEPLQPLLDEIDRHPLYAELRSLADLRVFMTHHVFAVWDFMCLIKYLQEKVAPVRVPWYPAGHPASRHLINRLVLEEDSDGVPGPDGVETYSSHFEQYCRAMTEVGADGTMPFRFLDRVREKGVDQALYCDLVPLPARYFSETTFAFIREDKPHEVAAALAIGRERIVPRMFHRLSEQTGISASEAPAFYLYLNRHIHAEENVREGLSMQLLDELCGGDSDRVEQAETAAEEVLCARIRFWDGIRAAILDDRMKQLD